MALENSRIVFSAARLRTPWVFPAHVSRYTRRRDEFITIKQVSSAMVLVIAGGLTYSVACVLSSRLFCAALELAMSEWRRANPKVGWILDDMFRLLDLRFANVFSFCEYEARGAKSIGQPRATLAAAGRR